MSDPCWCQLEKSKCWPWEALFSLSNLQGNQLSMATVFNSQCKLLVLGKNTFGVNGMIFMKAELFFLSGIILFVIGNTEKKNSNGT